MGDYRHFHDDILRLHQALAGRAMLTSYEGFEVSLIGKGRGAVSVHVQATAEEAVPAKLAYGFEIDQSFLPAIAADISRLFLSGPEADPPGPEATAPRRRLITMRSCRSAMVLLPVRVKRKGSNPCRRQAIPPRIMRRPKPPAACRCSP